MSNSNESAHSRKSLRHTRGTTAEEEPYKHQSGDPVTSGQVPTGQPAEGHPPAERRSRRAADAPVDAQSTHPGERLSQTRARDREALRAYRALAEQRSTSEPAVEPSRRQRRTQQVSTATRSHPTLPRTPDAKPALEVDRPVAGLGPVREGGRRDRRRRSDEPALDTGGLSTEPTGQAAAAVDPQAAPTVDKMSVEQALAARQAIVGEAQEQVAEMAAARQDDPFTVDLEILAQQKALAERASVLNSRAQKMQQLSQANEQRKPNPNDPTTAHNLSIVSPKEFIRVPGVPPTAPKASPSAGASVGPAPAGPVSAHPAEPIPHAVSGAAVPIGARTAHGLEPLDAMTAGLARVKRLQLMQYSIVSLGALALITGIMMIAGVFN
ncbi:hypothetical protein [Arthrobacter sp. CAN_A1]|uniref:hypothetical protein n=1 Tax=Arthrobacter sp. CAN_A1 TaxID=2787717 RepID=UPI0018C919EB